MENQRREGHQRSTKNWVRIGVLFVIFVALFLYARMAFIADQDRKMEEITRDLCDGYYETC